MKSCSFGYKCVPKLELGNEGDAKLELANEGRVLEIKSVGSVGSAG